MQRPIRRTPTPQGKTRPSRPVLNITVRGTYNEIYFSVVQRKLLTPDDFADLDNLAGKITAFEHRYNNAARPFDWRFGRNDLNRLIERIAA